VAKHIAAYLYKKHGKEVLSIFTTHFQKEAKNCFWDSNDRPLYSEEKAAQDIINEKPFTWLELPDDFSASSNKCSCTDDLEVDIDNTSILTSKTINFLSPAQTEEYQSNQAILTSTIVGPSQTVKAADSISEAISMEGIEGHSKPLALD